MKARWHGFYSTGIYLPLSSFSRRLRRLSRRLRGKQERFLQDIRLPQVSWKQCVKPAPIRLWEAGKSNGNIRISELGILAHFAANCTPGTHLFEIGTFDGRTSLNLAVNAPGSCRIHTLDLPRGSETRFGIAPGEKHMIDKERSGLRYEKFRESHPELTARIVQHYGDSAAFDYSPLHGSCSLIFVDGSHASDYVVSDTENAFRLARRDATIIWHDYGIWEGVTRTLEELEAKEQLGLRNIAGTSLVCWTAKSPARSAETPAPGERKRPA